MDVNVFMWLQASLAACYALASECLWDNFVFPWMCMFNYLLPNCVLHLFKSCMSFFKMFVNKLNVFEVEKKLEKFLDVNDEL